MIALRISLYTAMSTTKHAGLWQRTINAVCRPGKLVSGNVYVDIEGTADVPLSSQQKTLLSSDEDIIEALDKDEESDVEKAESQPRHKISIGTSLFDKVTRFAGTPFVLFSTILALLTWMVLGIVLGPTQTWQIALQNTSSIQCYISDTLLMRQQHNSARDLLTLIYQLRSRNVTCRRILQRIQHERPGDTECPPAAIDGDGKSMDPADYLPAQSLYGRICDWFVWGFSSLYAFIVYWIGIFIWLGFGASASLQWGNNWQLYINSATAVEITLVSIFLQNTRQRHMNYLNKCFESIIDEDRLMESQLRQVDGDTEPNPAIQFQYDYRGQTTRGNRVIDYYAAIIGSGVGLVISAIIFSVWIAIGHFMQWNSNWWLIIGTYTGLVGFLDGFVLRNVYFRGSRIVDDEFRVLMEEDTALRQLFAMRLPQRIPSAKISSLEDRISTKVGYWCSTSAAVLGSCVVIVAVLAIATGMLWSETGQLICNTPTMIVEGFLLLVLIQAHNMTHRQRRLQFQDVLMRRQEMNLCIRHFPVRGFARKRT